ncbi:siderophore-interacting protein [Microbacterium sp. cf332]|uniref:siderophore-interacting protein n=1 Tax=Microbacterium sp. cf332 TaxID=1761804 RepID=UPI00088A28D2|nr:siderophore-interacting protein [Microbacterium sp. cf332]SDQ27040.1 NADPH-dependent ferric siderophore reductase, contains FAD-binding and SIP domains [Microbacterium sp. cf332]
MSAPTATPSFRIDRRALDLHFRSVRLVARQWLTPGYVRVRLEGVDLRGFDSPGCDDHIRVFFPEVPPDSIDEMRAAPSREYTPLAWDPDDCWLDLEFALHGGGVAAAWAANAELGSTVGIGGPRGSAVLTGRPDGWLLAGDETAVPAIRRFVHLMDADAVGRVLVEVDDRDHELPIAPPPGVVVEQVHRGAASAGTPLAARLETLVAADRPAGAVFAFVAAEQSIVRPARRLLLDRWGLEPDQMTVKGYWKRGEPEYHAPH